MGAAPAPLLGDGPASPADADGWGPAPVQPVGVREPVPVAARGSGLPLPPWLQPSGGSEAAPVEAPVVAPSSFAAAPVESAVSAPVAPTPPAPPPTRRPLHARDPEPVMLDPDGTLPADPNVTRVVRNLKPQARLLGWLVILKGRNAGTDFRITGAETTIGRDPKCDVTLDDDTVSRLHARLTRSQKRFVFEDAGSSNGSSLNGTKIATQVDVQDGDVLKLGDLWLLFKEAAPRPRTS